MRMEKEAGMGKGLAGAPTHSGTAVANASE
jgi:hypothetical protein